MASSARLSAVITVLAEVAADACNAEEQTMFVIPLCKHATTCTFNRAARLCFSPRCVRWRSAQSRAQLVLQMAVLSFEFQGSMLQCESAAMAEHDEE
jgi:hypothetical protein